MYEVVRVGDRVFQITKAFKVPSRLPDDKLNESLDGIIHLRRIINGDRYIYFVNEAVDAKFEDVQMSEEELEKRKKDLLDAAEKVLEDKEIA